MKKFIKIIYLVASATGKYSFNVRMGRMKWALFGLYHNESQVKLRFLDLFNALNFIFVVLEYIPWVNCI